MFSRKVLFIFATILVVQAHAASIDEEWEKIENWFKNSLKTLEEKATEVSSKAQAIVAKEEKKISEFVANLTSKYEKTMAELEEKATKKDVKSCFNLIPYGAMDFAKNLSVGAVKCVADMVIEAKNIVTSVANDVKNINETLVGAKSTWEECSTIESWLKQDICKVKAVATASAAVTKSGVQIAEQVAIAYKFVSSAEQKVEACLALKLAAASFQGVKDLGKLTVCVVENIHV